MQVVFLPKWMTLVLFIVMWFVFQLASALWCKGLDVTFFQRDHFLFKLRSWEKNGGIYQKLFHVRVWKKYLPDGAALSKDGYRKRHLQDFSKQNLALFVAESRRAELSHWLAVVPFWVFGFFAPPFVIGIMLLYALAVNLPCIIVQRYNRPRIERLLRKL